MARKCYISFKTEDKAYKLYIQQTLNVDMIDKSLDNPIDSSDEDYIMNQIRAGYLSDSTVTILLIGEHGAENQGQHEQRFIKRELQASLYHGKQNTQNGILGIVLPTMYERIYGGKGNCIHCGNVHNYININPSTTINEFSYNYYIPHDKCSWSEDDRYCILVKWDDFVLDPENYIELAFNKRSHQISNKTKVRP